MNSLCPPWKGILRTQTCELDLIRSMALYLLFGVQNQQYWAQIYSTDLKAIRFRNFHALVFQKVKYNAIYHKSWPLIVRRKRSTWIHNSRTQEGVVELKEIWEIWKLRMGKCVESHLMPHIIRKWTIWCCGLVILMSFIEKCTIHSTEILCQATDLSHFGEESCFSLSLCVIIKCILFACKFHLVWTKKFHTHVSCLTMMEDKGNNETCL